MNSYEFEDYTSVEDYITAVVEPALGNCAVDFDMHDIASEMLVWTEGGTLVERDDVDFWEVVERHDISE